MPIYLTDAELDARRRADEARKDAERREAIFTAALWQLISTLPPRRES